MSERQVPDFEELKEWVFARVTEEGECWLWNHTTSAGVPQGTFKGKSINIRRYLLAAKRGLSLDGKWVAVCSCKNPDCVNPDHFVQTTRSKRLSGRKQSATHKAATAKFRRSIGKLTMEGALDVRYGEGTITEKASRNGISKEWARRIFNGDGWKEYASPFAGLGGRGA